MSVAVDEAGENKLSAGVNRLWRVIFRFERDTWPDGDNRVAFYGNGSVVVNDPRAVHGDDRASGDDQVDFFFLRCRPEWVGSYKNQDKNDEPAQDHFLSQGRKPGLILMRGRSVKPRRTRSIRKESPGSREFLRDTSCPLWLLLYRRSAYRKPSSPLIWSLVSPPTRGSGLPLSVTATATTISLARGAALIRTSMPSK